MESSRELDLALNEFLASDEARDIILNAVNKDTGYKQEILKRYFTVQNGRVHFKYRRYTLNVTDKGIAGIPNAFLASTGATSSRRKYRTAFEKIPGGKVRRLWGKKITRNSLPHDAIAQRLFDKYSQEITDIVLAPIDVKF